MQNTKQTKITKQHKKENTPYYLLFFFKIPVNLVVIHPHEYRLVKKPRLQYTSCSKQSNPEGVEIARLIGFQISETRTITQQINNQQQKLLTKKKANHKTQVITTTTTINTNDEIRNSDKGL